MPIRIVRIIEHEYADAEEMARDMRGWFMGQSRVYRANPKHTVRSATLPPQYLDGVEREEIGGADAAD